jgi:chromosome segregation ATPase
MATTAKLVDSIANRLQTVVDQMRYLRQDNQSLHKRLEQAKQELAHKRGSIRELKMKLEAAQTAKSIKSVGQSSARAKSQIDKLIGEIDACLDAISLS